MFCVPDWDHPLRHASPALLGNEFPGLISPKGPVAHGDTVLERSPTVQPTTDAGEIESAAVAEATRQLFMEEDEMASWIQYEIGDDDGGRLYRELLAAATGETPADRGDVEKMGVERSRVPTVVESSETPVVEGQAAVVMGLRKGPSRSHAGDGKKRKAREGDGSGCQSQDAEFESGDKRKDTHRPASLRRSRAAELHNLSERRRRDRIKEKMKTLQELIPRCNKSDKASTLDEAIEYLKSLQLQVHLMSAGCNMGPVMFPGVQTFLPPMGTGMGVGVGMGTVAKMGPAMGAGGLGRPVLQYGPFLPCPPIAAPVPAQFGPRLLVPSFHSPTMAIADQSGVEAPGQRDPTTSNSVGMQGTNMLQTPRTGDPYYPNGTSVWRGDGPDSCITDEPGTSKRTDDADNNILG